jgi:hypothetical protein
MPPKTSTALPPALPPVHSAPPEAKPTPPPSTSQAAGAPPASGDHVARPPNAGVLLMQSALADGGGAHIHKPKGDKSTSTAKTATSGKASATDLAQFDTKIAAIRNHPAYTALSADGKKTTEDIITTARTKSNPIYYADKLKLLFDTPDAPPTTVASSNSQQVSDSIKASKTRLQNPVAKANITKEEKITADKARVWTTLSGVGATYKVDRSDVENVVVKMKVQLTGNAKDVANTKALEDDIEKKAAAHGYTLDIEFVDHGGADVFTVKADPTKWTTSGNWVGSTFDIAHEAHHLLNLDDRYDYIESHADNAEMDMETRLHWFNVQAKKPFDANGKHSIMGDGAKPLHDDVCNVTQTADQAQCVKDRTAAHGGR